MKTDVSNETCPARQALELLPGKWALPVISALGDSTLRNNALLRRLDGISQKVLSQTLRALEQKGLVERVDHQTVPPRVEYRLTPMGRSLSEALTTLDRWAEVHQAQASSPSQGSPA
jgi:DNA-binding HxlR family transcriptional regulator